MTRTIRRILPALLAAGLLTACGNAAEAPSDSSDRTTTVEQPAAIDDTDTDTDAGSEDLTDTAIDITWATSTEDDKDALCSGIILFGTDWAADQLRQGGGDDAGIDWDRAALLIQDKCENR